MRRMCFALLVIASVAVAPVTVAYADHKASHDPNGGQKKGSGVTEDNDGDGVGNNIPDNGDNAHPSGNDKSVESGNSGNQGSSPSDPDGMSNGGEDKPGGTGGVDQIDQDGNNGCGNDDDFEDDNNGKCLGQKKKAAAEAKAEAEVEEFINKPAPAGTPFNMLGEIGQIFVVPESARFSASGFSAEEAAVEPAASEANAGVLGAVGETGTKVLGTAVDAGTGALSAASGLLPKTGLGIALLIAGALALIGAGLYARRYAASRQQELEPVAEMRQRELISA